jgi:peptide/nickel transport system substrate-binding protein
VRGNITYAAGATNVGVQADLLVQKIQSDLNAVGMKIDLDGLAFATANAKYRSGQAQMYLARWQADWPDASDFLVFLPGRTVGTRAGWVPDSTPEATALTQLAQQAESEFDPTKRVQLYQNVDRMITEIGPYAPLFQPVVPYAFRSNVSGVTYNSVWGVDFYTMKTTG